MKTQTNLASHSTNLFSFTFQRNPQLIMMANSLTQTTLPNTKALNLDDSLKDYLAFAFQNDSEFVEVFNVFFLKLRQTGLLNKIYQRWIPRSFEEAKPDQLISALGFENLSFPFMGLMWGALVAGLIVLVEKCNFYCNPGKIDSKLLFAKKNQKKI